MTDAKHNHASRRKRKRKGRKPHATSESPAIEEERCGAAAPPLPAPSPPSPQSNGKRRKIETPSTSKTRPGFLEKMRMRLSGGHFRMLNEKLYTCSGTEAFNYFKNDPKLFDVYHAGYQEQMLHWPEQPVNTIIKWIKKHNSSLIVADFGCGSATIARNVKNKVFSIDLVSNDPSVISCDMAHTPLKPSSIDVAVFCLSLMGTTYPNYLREAKRVLKPSGWLLIAEVRSRFDPNNGGADPDKFYDAVSQLGFSLSSKDFSNKMFVLFYFKKTEKNSKFQSIEWPELKPCIYKRR